MNQKNYLKCRGTICGNTRKIRHHCAQKERGITLIALVITIILLLILAGVTLKIVLDGNFVDKTQTAVDKYAEQQAREKLNIAIMTYKILKYSGENEKTFEETIKEIGGEIEHKEAEGIYKVKLDGYEFEIDDKELTIKEETNPTEPEKPEEKKKYTITVEKEEGISSVSPTTQNIEEGKNIEAIATVESGYIFDKWEIVTGTATIASKTNAKTTIKPTSNVTIKATAYKPTIALSNGNNLTGTTNGTVTGYKYTYTNPVIPTGFKALETTDASWNSTDGKTIDGWNNGLVITDAENDGNEFVWVPVDNVNVKYEKWLGSNNSSNITSLNQLSDDTLSNGITNEEEQITKYGGFYIGRYEAGIPSNLSTALTTASKDARNVSGTPVVKKNQVPWNYIDYNTAKSNAKDMYTGSGVKSGLLTGKSWDATMRWLKNSDVNVETDCIGWGNFADAPVTGITQYSPQGDFGASWTSEESSRTKLTNGTNYSDYVWLLKTGHTDYTKKKNLYDLAGNLWEWTNEWAEINSVSYSVRRGGFYGNGGKGSTASTRVEDKTSSCGNAIGFRIVLYIQ